MAEWAGVHAESPLDERLGRAADNVEDASLNSTSLRTRLGAWLAAGVVTLGALTGAQAAMAYSPKVLRVGFVPSENLQRILKNSRPVIEALRRELHMQVVPFVATDYTGIIEAMRANKLDVAFFAPGAYVLAEKKANARVILKASRKGKAWRVNVRSGPGTDFDVVAQAPQGARLDLVGRNEAGDWWQVCCVDGQRGWITDELIAKEGPVEQVELSPDLPTATPIPSPTPTSAPTPAATATATPEPSPTVAVTPTADALATPFVLTEETAFPFGDHDYFRVGARVSDGADRPLGGYYLRVRNETTGQTWLSRQTNGRTWSYSAPSSDFADFRQINVEFDTDGQAPLLGHSYSVWLVDGGGRRVSPIVRLDAGNDEPQWLYVAFTRQ